MLPAGFNPTGVFSFEVSGKTFSPPEGSSWGTSPEGMKRLVAANRVFAESSVPRYVLYFDDYPVTVLTDNWSDAVPPTGKTYAVQTDEGVVSRCMLMTTDPGDLVFDPTCGSGTTARVAELWGRRWITCDSSRVAVNVTRTNLLSLMMPHYVTRNGTPSSGFSYETVPHVTMGSIANGLEPESIELSDRPFIDPKAVRVCGPFECMSIGRYSVEDWKGYIVAESPRINGEPAKLENYIDVICRLYRQDAATQGASGLLHAVAETEREKIGISVGPLSGRVTARQINDAVRDALASGIREVHVLGWAFEANVGEMKSRIEAADSVKVALVMIRPDTLAEGLKITQPEMLFSPFALPDIDVKLKRIADTAEATVTLEGVALFDRKHRRTEYKRADSGYVSAWYLDEDYDGDCFVDCQMFFDLKKAPNLRAVLQAKVGPEDLTLQFTSRSFPLRGHKRIAVKVVDIYGNESTTVREFR
jgi:adenine-specific DNA-methyltransferase